MAHAIFLLISKSKSSFRVDVQLHSTSRCQSRDATVSGHTRHLMRAINELRFERDA
ncbi:Uncharacterized protein DAT39_000075 [Clarias magur]|uniref:Uncharacterized protein n=1 Tax=Clarias magur TaxID=1594786 RepID=A0A8J5BNI3_CLAMG|nr:Uncharacterized protein DAT39_000075 [Clarias magur]